MQPHSTFCLMLEVLNQEPGELLSFLIYILRAILYWHNLLLHFTSVDGCCYSVFKLTGVIQYLRKS